jgi:glucose-1-phosphate cytidylyltransferase
MKTIILCGGKGTRLSEETGLRPKPMVEIGEKPILWHIMQSYAHSNFKEFYLALGYKQEYIKDYFINFYSRSTDFKVDLSSGSVDYLKQNKMDWNVNLIDTGEETLTGGRVKRLKEYIGNETFMLTYGDGVCDVDIDELVKFHKSHGKLATVTAVRPPARFGEMLFDGDVVTEFKEKPRASVGWINGGFFVLEPEVFDFIPDGDDAIFEKAPLENLASAGELVAYKHEGFWQCMDTMRDKKMLNELWDANEASWWKNV